MTTKTKTKPKPADVIDIPALTVKKTNRVFTPPVRIPAPIYAEGIRVMNLNNWTPTEFQEKAWTLLISFTGTDVDYLREIQALLTRENKKDPEFLELARSMLQEEIAHIDSILGTTPQPKPTKKP